MDKTVREAEYAITQLGAAALCCMIPGSATDAAGIALIIAGVILDKMIFKPKAKTLQATDNPA